MITHDGWLDWAIRRPGPAYKVNGGRNGLLGLAAHSAEGYEAGLWEVLDGPRQASWHFSNMKDGRLFQHYPLLSQTWTSGASYPNNNMPGMETEGVEGQPLTDAQNANVARILRELRDYTGRQKVERIGARTSVPAGVLAVVEHRECTRWGAPSTSCPSNRYDWGKILGQLNPPLDEPFTYTRQQALWAINALGFNYGMQKFGGAPPRLHPFDTAIIKDIAGKLE